MQASRRPPPDDGALRGRFERSPLAGAGPAVTLAGRTGDQEWLNASIPGLPERVTVDLHPGERLPADGCRFKLDTTTPIPMLALHFGRGMGAHADWAREAADTPTASWLAIDQRTPGNAIIDARLFGIDDTRVCTPGDAFDATVTIGATPDLRVAWSNATAFMKARMEGVTGGTYSATGQDGRYSYRGSALPVVHVSGRLPMARAFMGATVDSFSLDARGVPPGLDVTIAEAGVTLFSSARVAGVNANVTLVERARSTAPPSTWEQTVL